MSEEFTEYLVDKNVIEFGEFKLKSGRKSPYFFNFGAFNNAAILEELGEFYAEKIYSESIDFDVIFGSAYKGIPIALSVCLALKRKYSINKEFAFNRKEEKEYGDKGSIVGATLKNKKILAVDDVLTSGKTVLETKNIVQEAEGELTYYLVALNRKEKYITDDSMADDYIKKHFNINIESLSNINDIISCLKSNDKADSAKKLSLYLNGDI